MKSADDAGPKPGVVYSFLVVACSRMSLRFFGFRRTLRLVKRAALGSTSRAPEGSPLEAAKVLATAAAFFPGRAICLEQSVALYYVLRRRGFPVALRIGVQPYPFQAHAWVELDGEPLLENADFVQKFVPFPQAFA